MVYQRTLEALAQWGCPPNCPRLRLLLSDIEAGKVSTPDGIAERIEQIVDARKLWILSPHLLPTDSDERWAVIRAATS